MNQRLTSLCAAAVMAAGSLMAVTGGAQAAPGAGFITTPTSVPAATECFKQSYTVNILVPADTLAWKVDVTATGGGKSVATAFHTGGGGGTFAVGGPLDICPSAVSAIGEYKLTGVLTVTDTAGAISTSALTGASFNIPKSKVKVALSAKPIRGKVPRNVSITVKGTTATGDGVPGGKFVLQQFLNGKWTTPKNMDGKLNQNGQMTFPIKIDSAQRVRVVLDKGWGWDRVVSKPVNLAAR